MTNDYNVSEETNEFHIGNVSVGTSEKVIRKMNELMEAIDEYRAERPCSCHPKSSGSPEEKDVIARNKVKELIMELSDFTTEDNVTIKDLGINLVELQKDAPKWANYFHIDGDGKIFYTLVEYIAYPDAWVGPTPHDYYKKITIPEGINWKKCQFSLSGE